MVDLSFLAAVLSFTVEAHQPAPAVSRFAMLLREEIDRTFLDIKIPVGYDFCTVPPPFRHARLRKVQPFLISEELAGSLDTAVESMTSPMFPRVTLAGAVRELLVPGCDLIEVELNSSKRVAWTVADPPRGPRRQEARTTVRDARVPTDSYQQLSPVSLPEPLIERLHDLVQRITKITGVKTTLTKLMREALSRACAERERVRRASETFVRENAVLLALAGFHDPAQFKVVATGISGRMPPPRPAKQARPARPTHASAKATKATGTKAKVSQPRARAPRRKATPRRVTKGEDGDDDGGGDGPGHQSGPRADASSLPGPGSLLTRKGA